MRDQNTFVLAGLVTMIILTSAVRARAATWTQKTDMPTGRNWLSTCVVDGKIYAFGGEGGRKKVEVYDPVTETWTKKADMPTPRMFVASSVVDGTIYVIGGNTSWHGGTALATVEAYDPATDTWTRKADLSAPRDGMGASVVNGKIYAIGGGVHGQYLLATVEAYDPTTDTWTKKADLPTAREIFSTSVVNGKIYAIGGQSRNAWPAFATVEAYDPATDTWASKADMPAPRAALSTTVADGKIYAFGGVPRRGGVPDSTLFRYDPATDTWTQLENMPIPMAGMSASQVGTRTYLIGGTSTPYPYAPFLSAVWEYDIGLTVPSPDFNGDGIVDSADMSALVDHWHTDNALYDIAPLPFGDDFVDVQDLIFLSEHLFQEVDDPTLMAHWALDEAEGFIAADSVSENGFSDGIVIGDPAWQPAGGQVDGAIQLDGVDDYIIASHVLNPADGPFSVLAWIKGGAPGQVIISQMDSITGGETWLGIDPLNGCLMTELVSPPIGRFIAEPLESNHIITDDIWHHIGFVWDGSYRTLYVDGLEVAKDTDVLTSLKISDGGLYIGTNINRDAGTFFSGLIDDVRIYNRVISP